MILYSFFCTLFCAKRKFEFKEEEDILYKKSSKRSIVLETGTNIKSIKNQLTNEEVLEIEFLKTDKLSNTDDKFLRQEDKSEKSFMAEGNDAETFPSGLISNKEMLDFYNEDSDSFYKTFVSCNDIFYKKITQNTNIQSDLSKVETNSREKEKMIFKLEHPKSEFEISLKNKISYDKKLLQGANKLFKIHLNAVNEEYKDCSDKRFRIKCNQESIDIVQIMKSVESKTFFKLPHILNNVFTSQYLTNNDLFKADLVLISNFCKFFKLHILDLPIYVQIPNNPKNEIEFIDEKINKKAFILGKFRNLLDSIWQKNNPWLDEREALNFLHFVKTEITDRILKKNLIVGIIEHIFNSKEILFFLFLFPELSWIKHKIKLNQNNGSQFYHLLNLMYYKFMFLKAIINSTNQTDPQIGIRQSINKKIFLNAVLSVRILLLLFISRTKIHSIVLQLSMFLTFSTYLQLFYNGVFIENQKNLLFLNFFILPNEQGYICSIKIGLINVSDSVKSNCNKCNIALLDFPLLSEKDITSEKTVDCRRILQEFFEDLGDFKQKYVNETESDKKYENLAINYWNIVERFFFSD